MLHSKGCLPMIGSLLDLCKNHPPGTYLDAAPSVKDWLVLDIATPVERSSVKSAGEPISPGVWRR